MAGQKTEAPASLAEEQSEEDSIYIYAYIYMLRIPLPPDRRRIPPSPAGLGRLLNTARAAA